MVSLLVANGHVIGSSTENMIVAWPLLCRFPPCVLHQQTLFFLTLLGSLTATVSTTVLLKVQPQIVGSDDVTLTCVIEPASDWNFIWYNDSSSKPFRKTVVNHISVKEGLYRCQGELSLNHTSVSNPVLIKGHKSSRLAVGVVIGVVVGSVLTVFLLKIHPYCFPRLRALCSKGKLSLAPSSGQTNGNTHYNQNWAQRVRHHIYETVTEDFEEVQVAGPETVYAMENKPKTTNSTPDHAEGGNGPKTVYVKLDPSKTTAQHGDARKPQTVYVQLTPGKNTGSPSPQPTHV